MSPGTHVTRSGAAKLLHEARRATRDGGEAADWAFSVLPDSAPARRLKVRHLIDHGDLDGADALIAAGLRHRPTDASLTFLRARVLAERGRHADAERELRLALARRPNHAATLLLAGRVALALGDPLRAALLLQRAVRRRPAPAAMELLIEAWLATGRPHMARRVMRRLDAPPAMLRARLLTAEGRVLDAIEVLEAARREPGAADRQAITCALIDLLEQSGGVTRLRQLLTPVRADEPAVLSRAGLAWLKMGAFTAAAVRMARLARVRGHRAEALVVLMVAASMVGRARLAERALARLRRIDEPVDRARVAEAWCRGLTGRLLLEQCSPRRAGADPHTGQLRKLLLGAGEVLHDELAAGGRELPKARRRELRRLLGVCEQAAPGPDEVEAAPPAPAALLSPAA